VILLWFFFTGAAAGPGRSSWFSARRPRTFLADDHDDHERKNPLLPPPPHRLARTQATNHRSSPFRPGPPPFGPVPPPPTVKQLCLILSSVSAAREAASSPHPLLRLRRRHWPAFSSPPPRLPASPSLVSTLHTRPIRRTPDRPRTTLSFLNGGGVSFLRARGATPKKPRLLGSALIGITCGSLSRPATSPRPPATSPLSGAGGVSLQSIRAKS
jgi:hypothetical protein